MHGRRLRFAGDGTAAALLGGGNDRGRGGQAVDAFSQEWRGEQVWAHPPPALLLQLVQLLAVFQRVFDSLNLPAHNWSAINDFAATVVRLVELERSVGEGKASELV